MANRLKFVNPSKVASGNDLSGRSVVTPEELSILVELTSTLRSRSYIENDTNNHKAKIVNNEDQPSKAIGFLEGTNVGGRRTLTTNYTEVNTNLSVDGDNDLEALGIESINIKFDTAYTPNIQIKFIDVRGHAVLGQGNDSRYRMFFDLPYPIFNLTIKGFYGKPVTYCLHLTKWNASFNSSTGNFEIDTNFIGYTYALLTDCIIGLMRAVPYTTDGKEVIADRGDADTFTTIDELIDKIAKVDDEIDGIREDSENVRQLNALNSISDTLDSLNSKIAAIKSSITIPDDKYTKSGNILVVPDKSLETDLSKLASNEVNKGLRNALASYLNYIKDNIDGDNGLNKKIKNSELKLNTDKLKSIIKITNISAKNLDTETNFLKNATTEKNLTASSVDGNSTVSGSIENASTTYPEGNASRSTIFKTASAYKPSNDNINIEILDLILPTSEILNRREQLEKVSKELKQAIAEEFINKSLNLSLEPTISNLIGILASNAEVLLKTIELVAKKASSSSVRKDKLLNIIEDLNVGKKSTATDIYPWPEYRKKDIKGIPEESYLGELFDSEDELKSIPELQFIEELLAGLFKIGREDLDRDRFETGVRTPSFYPVSPADSSVIKIPGTNDFYIKNNPYYNAALNGSGNVVGNPEEITRCLLMRGFLAFGVSNRIPFDDSDPYPEFLGAMEAANAINAIITESVDRGKARDLITKIANEGGGNAKDAATAIINLWKTGTDNVKNPTGKVKPLLKEVGSTASTEYYRYVYIDDSSYLEGQKAYLPISDNFDGQAFYKDGKIKSASELKSLSDTVLFTGTYHGDIINSSTTGSNARILNVNSNSPQGRLLLTTFSPQSGQKVSYEDDGSVYVKIVNTENYRQRINSPQFGEEKFETYNNSGWINQDSLKELTYSDKGIPTLNRYNSPTNKALEFSYIIYDGDADSNENTYNTNINGPDDTEYLGDISSIYWADNRQDYTLVNGTYLCSSLKEEFFSYQNIYETKLYIDFNDPESRIVVENSSNGIYRESHNYLNQWGKQKEIIPSNKGYLPYIEFGLTQKSNTENISLFGSTFYYGQDNKEAKAFLFLNSFTWQGIMGDINDRFKGLAWVGVNTEDVSLFDVFDYDGNSFKDDDETYSVKGIFSNYGAHIKAPKMWCAYIGSLLYRLDTWLVDGKDIIKFKDGSTMFFPRQDDNSYTPTPLQYIRPLDGEVTPSTAMALFFDKYDAIRGDDDSDAYEEYPVIDRGIIGLPQQVRTEFKNIFLEFVENEFEEIRTNLELFDDLNDKKNKWINLYNSSIENRKATTPKKIKKQNGQQVEEKVDNFIKTSDITTTFNGNDNIKNYYNISPISSTGPKGGSFSGVKDQPWWKSDTGNNVAFPEFNLLLADNTNVMRTIIGYMKTPVYITNIKPDVFRSAFTSEYLPSSRSSSSRDYIQSTKKDMDRYLVAFFNEFIRLSEDWTKNEDNDALKKRLFNTTDNADIKLNLYRTIASIYNKWIAGGTDKCIRLDGLAETFKYLDKDFRNIGDLFYINPRDFSRRIRANYNQNFFDVANRTLSENNFNFIPLPSFINFNSQKELEDVFRPFPYKEAIPFGEVSPSFVCVYVGQTSTNLAIDGSETPDDGVFLRLDDSGKNPINIPEGFNEEEGENIPYFLVNYGEQTQSIFKDIKLDQREFTETAESLQIIEDITKESSESSKKGTFNSQNLFNVYQKRSYSAQIEMMGNAMIQPMMYFQLNNIPMFRGAYLIISVNHSLSPNNMTTSFKGVRIKGTKTKLIEKKDFYISLIGDTSNAGEATSITGKVNRPGESAISNAAVNSNTITNSNGLYVEVGGGVYIVDSDNGLAGQTLREFMNDLSSYLNSVLPSKGIKLSFNGITRELKETSLGGPGRDKKSKHGAGLAIDVKFEGTYNNTQITNYSWPSSNTIVANDAEVMTQIKKYLTTNAKWKDTIKWGGDFTTGDKTSVVSTDNSIPNFKVRTNEIHHFEIVDAKIKDYFQPYNDALANLELSIPNRQKDLAAIYLKPFQFKEDERIALETVKNDDSEGDSVSLNNTSNA